MRTPASRAATLLLPIFAALLSLACSQASSGPDALPKSVAAADETSAIQTLRTIAAAQAQSKVIRGSYGDFDTLAQAGFLDARFATSTPVQRGYRFKMTATESEFSVSADPIEQTAGSRSRHLYLDSTDGVIHVNGTQAATRNDPAL